MAGGSRNRQQCRFTPGPVTALTCFVGTTPPLRPDRRGSLYVPMPGPHRSNPAERPAPPPRDSVLLERVAGGDRQALAELVARYSASLYALAFAILSDPAEAQEIVDRAFRNVRWEAQRFHPTHYPVGRWLADATREAAVERKRAVGRTPS